MSTSRLLVGLAGAGIFVLPAAAQDHPCVQPQDQFVAALCSDPELRAIADQQREEMMALWNRLSPQEQDKFREEQIAWRDSTARRCRVDQPSLQPLSAETKNCLRQAEARRIEFLRHYGQTDTPTALHPNALPRVTSPASVTATDDHGAAAYQDGLGDRAAWEQWFNSLQGDYKSGAFYWASQRSLSHPGSCQQMNGDFYAGCTQAKVKLSASDTRRKSEPSYKAGWNGWSPSSVTAPVAPPVAHSAEAQERERTVLASEPSAVAETPAVVDCPTGGTYCVKQYITGAAHITEDILQVYTRSEITKPAVPHPDATQIYRVRCIAPAYIEWAAAGDQIITNSVTQEPNSDSQDTMIDRLWKFVCQKKDASQ